ncbi:IclR family transcriptional regulator [Mesorhizobium sp.]|uniref:IclR family transcriptional regulator n=1 Tax=Mesorhizobium sp. TaxID=1871066 RepID=UPI00121E4C93|nr:IclR family transcriptional regulator [Mesorhizobium sp.]TIL30176.1 MAG: IclR family transcriptional regulator [Mesorhizobium sp.]
MTSYTTGKVTGGSMKTIDKALFLLDFFLPDTPEWRLSDLARAAGMDKVTVMRILKSLAMKGIVEQHPETKKYRLGTAVLRLARIREACFPVVAVLQPVLDWLAAETGESTHACLFSGSSMTTIAIAEPNRATRVFVDPAQPLPVYATASGLTYLAHARDAVAEETLARLTLRAYAGHTPLDIGTVRASLKVVRERGYAISSRTFEEDTTGIAAPVFDWHGSVLATIAAACVASRLTKEVEARIVTAVRQAAADATRAMGGDVTRTSGKRQQEMNV